MLANSLSVTYDGVAVTLNRLNQGGYAGLFQGVLASGNVLTLEVKNSFPTIPGRGTEQHLVKLSLESYTVIDGVNTLTGLDSVHMVLKTSTGVEDDARSLKLKKCFDTFATDENVTAVLQRQS